MNLYEELKHSVFSKIPEILKDTLGIDWDVPLEVEVEIGPTWGTMKPVDIR